MRKIISTTFVTLDGVMQAPGGKKEDTSGGFEYGGWQMGYGDEITKKILHGFFQQPFELLLGRVTYDIFAGFWPTAKEAQEVAVPFNATKKYVVSHLPAPRPNNNYFVYVILCDDDSMYIGQTNDIPKRWLEHTKGTAAEHTKKHKPVSLIHYEEFNSREEAVKREHDLKTGFGRKWLKREWKAGRTRQAGDPAFKATWNNSMVISGDVPAELRKLKEMDGPDLWVWGSGNLIQTLLKENLLDRMHIWTHPVTIGSGKRLFADGIPAQGWKLLDSVTDTTGVIAATYEPDGEIKQGPEPK